LVPFCWDRDEYNSAEILMMIAMKTNKQTNKQTMVWRFPEEELPLESLFVLCVLFYVFVLAQVSFLHPK
jgi:heme O synthase-like polyprenyltransferase